jgi:hypothetical protein
LGFDKTAGGRAAGRLNSVAFVASIARVAGTSGATMTMAESRDVNGSDSSNAIAASWRRQAA